jgi:DNA-binding transcriptional MocR family regulator
MGGVSHPSQLYAVELLQPERVAQAREAVDRHYGMQRARYGGAFANMGLGVHTGDGGFYHWLRLPDGLKASELNRRLFQRGAAILEGIDCDMGRPHAKDPDYVSPYESWFRFSFGPLLPETFEADVALMAQTLEEYRSDAAAPRST